MQNLPRLCPGRRLRVGLAGTNLRSFARILVLIAVATGCGSDVDVSDSVARLETVAVLRVEPEVLIDVEVFSGQLEAEHSVVVKPEIEGIIASIDFTQGQRIRAGEVLFTLRDLEQNARLREAEANRDLAGERWKRAKQLVSRAASSLDARDVAEAEYEMAVARVDLAKLQLDRTRIRAPFDGMTGRRRVDLGDRVESDTELVAVDAIDRVQLSFGITDEGLALARPGMRVSARVRPYPDERFWGEVFFVSPTLDPRNRRLLVKAWIPNEDHRLRPGLFANVDLELRRIENAIVVPESAVSVDQAGAYVWKIDEERIATRLPVELGLRERGVVEVISGLSAGTTIVVAGTHKVSEGQQVRVSAESLIGHSPVSPSGEGT